MILLDTCALLWTVNQEPILAAARKAISRAESAGGLYVSPVSAWEIGLLVRCGRLELEIPAEAYVEQVFHLPGIRVAALTPEIAVRSSYLPGGLHEDPADRLLVSTSLIMGLKLITRDRRLLDYGAQGFAAVMAC
jgi:PIN domain nuclease of toxin-antitoxin system